MKVTINSIVENKVYFKCSAGEAYALSDEHFQINKDYDVEFEIDSHFKLNLNLFIEKSKFEKEKIWSENNKIQINAKILDIQDVLLLSFCGSIILIDYDRDNYLEKGKYIKIVFKYSDFYISKTNI